MTGVADGVAYCTAVFVLSMVVAGVVGFLANHWARARHLLGEARAAARHEEVKNLLDGQAKTLTALVTQYGRLDRTAADHSLVLEDHAERLESLLPGQRVLHPRPKP